MSIICTRCRREWPDDEVAGKSVPDGWLNQIKLDMAVLR